MRLVDADELYKKIFHEERLLEKCYVDHLGIITEQPTVDAVPVVRCWQCKHAKYWYGDKYLCSLWNEKNRVSVFSDGFCSYGERRGGDE